MKTNHARDFKDTRGRWRRRKQFLEVALSGVVIAATVDASDRDYVNGIHGYARSRRGAKKFVHSRIRRDTRDTLKKLEIEEC